MLAVVGTIPDENFPLVTGTVTLAGGRIRIQGRAVPVNRGTPALLAAAIKAGEVLKRPPPIAFLVGDIGFGKGSRMLYQYLSQHLGKSTFHTILFHYLQPDVDWHNRVLFAVEEMGQPLMEFVNRLLKENLIIEDTSNPTKEHSLPASTTRLSFTPPGIEKYDDLTNQRIKEILDESKIDIPIIGLAKRLEQIYLPDGKILHLDRNSNSSLLLQHIRDEAHRFAIKYHRKRREKIKT